MSLAKNRARHKGWVSRVTDKEILLEFELNHSLIPSHHESLRASEREMDLGFCLVPPLNRPQICLGGSLDNKLLEDSDCLLTNLVLSIYSTNIH